MLALFGVGGTVSVICNIWITDYKTNFLIQMIAVVVLGIGFFFLCESPFYLYKQMDIKRLYDSLMYIGHWNYKDKEKRKEIEGRLKNKLLVDSQDSFIEKANDLQIVPRVRKSSITELQDSFNWKMIKRLIFFSGVLGNIYIGNGLTLIIPAKLGLDNIYLNGALLGLAETLGYLIVYPIAHKLKRRKLILFYILSSFVSTTLFLVIEFAGWNVNFYGKLAETIISVTIKLILSMNYALVFTYGAELFPTKIRGMANGIAIFVGRSMNGVSSPLDALAVSWGVHPLVMISLGSIVALPCTLFLPETLHQQMQD